MADESLVREIFETAGARCASGRAPLATYRLQFNSDFTFRDAARLAPYLKALGVSHVYASPYLKARAGSRHGYDIINYDTLNPEIGTPDDYDFMVKELARYGLRQILDFVPNHMGMQGNAWWADVLENGPVSAYAAFFDIDWKPPRPEMQGKLLLPVLEDQYGKVLTSGKLRLAFRQGGFIVLHGPDVFPVDPGTFGPVLELCLRKFGGTAGRDADYRELAGITAACVALPLRSESDPVRLNDRRHAVEGVKERLGLLYGRSLKVKDALESVLDEINCSPDSDTLHRLLESQAYRLSHWHAASDELNYRRFFEIADLVGLRMEEPEVFERSHRFLRGLLREGAVSGVRVDHIDGLYDPAGYLGRLQESFFLDICRALIDGYPGLLPPERSKLEAKLAEKFRAAAGQGFQPLFVVVEKILAEKENLPAAWPVAGTTGYEFGALLNRLFIDADGEEELRGIYRRFTGHQESYEEVLYQSKKLIMNTSMRAELDSLARSVNGVAASSRYTRDFTLAGLRDALREVIACLPVYRTYIDAARGRVSEDDRSVIASAVGAAKKANPEIIPAIFDFIPGVLLLNYPPDMDLSGRKRQQDFVMRWQQTTGGITAKGGEDTALYRSNALLSLNEVGASPATFATRPDEFHRRNLERLHKNPQSLLATCTHDSKRSEDVRARLNVLSEIPELWREALRRWSALNRDKKRPTGSGPAPDPNEEYFIYQTLLGSLPPEGITDDYRERIKSYARKALREAKVHTSWLNPDERYEAAVIGFIERILDYGVSANFLDDFAGVARLVTTCGMYSSLSQVVLKIFSPGVPDIYRGTEMWDFSLVDPDNRRPVDYMRYNETLISLQREPDKLKLAQTLIENLTDGRVKLYVTAVSLAIRWENSELATRGEYLPLEVHGDKRKHACAFAWRKGTDELVVIAPVLTAGLTGRATVPPTGRAWGNTMLGPGGLRGRVYRNVFTGETVRVDSTRSLSLAGALATFPVCVLVNSDG